MIKTILFFASVVLMLSHSVYAKQFNVLVFTKTDGWHHQSINEGVDSIEYLAERHFFRKF